METVPRALSKDVKRQCFLTEIQKEDIKVRFESHGTSTPMDSFKFLENIPIASMILSNSKSQIRSVESKRMKTSGLSRLKSILKENKDTLSSKKSVNKESKEQQLSQSQANNKYFRISINDNELKQATENSHRVHQRTSSKNQWQKLSINKFLQRTQTEGFREKDYKTYLLESTRNMKRMQKRRKCRITTQEEFQDECTKYIQSKQKQETDELFRQMNRQMKLHQKRKEPNNYYQKIRRTALKKIDYMSYNQKYYDDAEVKHLYSVVENCNILIHKRSQNQKEKPNKRLQTERLAKDCDQAHIFKLTEKESTYQDEPLNRTSISAKDIHENEEKNTAKDTLLINKMTTSKTVKMTSKQKVHINKKISNIVQVCEKQRKMLEEVKNGMKVFEFYCNKMDSGFAFKGKRLNNFIIGQDQC